MAQVLKAETEQRILASAVEEFFQKDFRTANMRSIAARAGIPTGLIYTYFKNKESLFEVVVRPVYLAVKNLDLENEKNGSAPFANFFNTEAKQLVALLSSYRKQFVILIEKSEGTKFEGSLEAFASLTEQHIKRHLTKKLCRQTVADDLVFHILAHNFIQGFVEIAKHHDETASVQELVDMLGKLYFYGVKALV